MSDLGKELVEGLDEFLQKLKSGEPIEATELQRIETPDGPMHIFRKVVLNGRKTDRDPEGELPDLFP